MFNLVLLPCFCHNKYMAIKQTNKQMMLVISKEDYARLERIAKDECRSVSKQALAFLLKEIKEYEEKRS